MLKEKLLQYNREDCVALKRVTDALHAIIRGLDGNGTGCAQAAVNPPFQHAADIELPKRPWGPVKFVLDDMKFVNTRAYFEYQRDKVYVRADTRLRPRKGGRRVSFWSRRFRINKRIEIEATACPHCGGADLRKGEQKHTKNAFDLRITSGGVSRLVVQCSAADYRCRTCNRSFVPPDFKNRAIYLHTLKSWAMHQHVAHRFSFRHIVRMFDELFGLPVSSTYLHMYKAQMAQEYAET